MARVHRGQTVVVALAILFMLILLGGIFVTMIMRNLQRANRSGDTDDALSLALAGLEHAAQQFKSSPDGADWRPKVVEPMWRNPTDASVSAQRGADPDRNWLDPSLQAGQPYVRFGTGRGRFLLKVTYLPRFRFSSRAAETAGIPDEFDPNSGMIRIESIGRPGEVDPNDPTSFQADPTAAGILGNPIGPVRKLEAYVPIGLTDQLWWITNVTNERGPAELGVTPFRDGNGRWVEYPSLLEGSLRANVDVLFHGRNVVRVYPARGEGVFVKGRIRFAQTAGAARPNQTAGSQPNNLRIQAVDDSGDPVTLPTYPKDDQDDNPFNDSLITQVEEDQSGQPAFTTVPLQNSGRTARHVVLDESFFRSGAGSSAQSTRIYPAPVLDQADAVTGINRWLRLTRDSGLEIEVVDDDPSTAAIERRLVNTGWFGLTDSTQMTPGIPTAWRARGLYLDNFGDIQYPNDRRAVRQEWLQQGSSDVRRRGWYADSYIPSVVEGGTIHPVAEIVLTEGLQNPANPASPLVPKIRITRWDMDQRQVNVRPNTGRSRLFYNLANMNVGAGQATLAPLGQTREFDYPPNGVVYTEGSVRVRGVLGSRGDPRRLTIVSGGSVYIEGCLMRPRTDVSNNQTPDPRAGVALLAQDYVCLNPTAFTRVRPGDDVIVEADTFGPNGEPTAYHYTIPQGSDLDFSFSAAEVRSPFTSAGNLRELAFAALHLKHSAVQDSILSETAISLMMPRAGAGWPLLTDRYDFSTNIWGLPYTVQAPAQRFYLFDQYTAGQSLTNWAISNYQTVAGSPANFERKSFLLPSLSAISPAVPYVPGQDATLRIMVGPRESLTGFGMSPNGQPYWLSRVAITPLDQPLPIKVEAAMYAYTGSWFVIPPPFFNDNDKDRRSTFGAQPRAPGTLPANLDIHPFYNEALNVDVEIVGAVTENMPAGPQEKAQWVNRMYVDDPPGAGPGYDPTVFPLQVRPPFSPNIRYRYDPMLRRVVRVRNARTGQEIIAWAAPGAPPFGMPNVQAAVLSVIGSNAYPELLPLMPKLPIGALLYEGHAL